MISRYFWQNPVGQRLFQVVRPRESEPKSGHRKRNGWLTLGWLTALFGLWLTYRWLLRPEWPDKLPLPLLDLLQISEVAGALALSLVWALLFFRLTRQSPFRPLPAVSHADLLELSPQEFEQFVAVLFRQKGFRVRHRGGSGDHGVDLEIQRKDGRRAIVQCKRYQRTVGEEVVRDLFGTLVHERAARAFLVTTADISAAAYDWASDKPMTLVDGKSLVDLASSLSAASRPT